MKNTRSIQKKRERVVPFLIISLMVHLLLLIGFKVNQTFSTKDLVVKKEDKPTVQFLDLSGDPRLQKQMVETLDESKIKPKDAKYLSAKDNAVKKETSATVHGDFQNVQSAEQTKANQQNQQQANQQKAVQQMVESNTAQNMKTFEGGDMLVPTKKKQQQKATTISELRPNTMGAMSESMAVVSQSPDVLKDVVAGAETHLNTREFMYYSYFNRIKKDLRQRWEPLIHKKVMTVVKKGLERELASTETKLTGIILTLDERGVIQKIQVRTTSGLSDLDDAAIEALQSIGQFPHPPKDLVIDGVVTIPWNFVLES